MSCRDDSDEIESFAIDFFNDVTGLSSYAEKAWDLQSKASANNSPKAIGKELITLFKNYMSEFEFDYFVLFLGGVSDSFRIDNQLNAFGIDNVKYSSRIKVIEGLKEEGAKKTYINNVWLTEDNINQFIDKVTFVIADKTKTEYVKSIVPLNKDFIPGDGIFESIFNTIRDTQSSKKNNQSIEGIAINEMSDVFAYDRIIKAKEIRLMALNVLTNFDIMNRSIPQSFNPVITKYDDKRQNVIVEDCKLDISAALFDKNNSSIFWDLFGEIVDTINKNKNLSVLDTYKLLANNGMTKHPKLDVVSVQYLISLIKETIDDYH